MVTHTPNTDTHTHPHADYPPSNSSFILNPHKTSTFLMFHLHALKKGKKTSKMNTSTISYHSISAQLFLSHALQKDGVERVAEERQRL